MLRFVATYDDKTNALIEKVLTVVMDCELGVPADSLVLTCPYSRTLTEKADYISAYLENELVFKGQIDEIINIKKADGVITKITARSLASNLLDNEAEPVTYNNPASEFIFNRHLKPLGIESYDADIIPFYGNLKIDKGMTHWQVFQNFCKNRYGVEPRISGNGKAYFRGYKSNDIVIFGENSDSVNYYSAKENKLRCKLISEVKLKLNEFGTYSGSIINENPDCKNIERVRYVNATSDRSTIQTADKIISQSNLDSYSVLLECHGCHINLIGHIAEVNDSVFGRMENLVVNKVRYTLDSNGENTSVTLGKEKV